MIHPQSTHKFTEADAQLSSVIMALLDVCALATESIEEVGTQEHVRRYASSVSMTIKHTLDVFVEFHEKLDNLNRLEVTA